jgi:2-oxoglutarate-Fe(II)-dependent oxygenase superfamily protein
MLNRSLDLNALHGEFAKDGRIRIRNVLEPAVADAIANDLNLLPCQLFCATGKGVAVLDLKEMAQWDRERHLELQRELYQAAARAEGFAYLGARLTEAWKNGAPDTALGRFHTALTSPEMMEAMRTITGASTFDNAFAQATSYRPSHYLTRHLDDPKGEHRRFAFVWGFTRKWDPDWGGLLQFFGDDGLPRDALSPDFNTLDLFDVRHVHSVTLVAPWAAGPRVAISGWFVKGDPLKPMSYTHTGKA